MSNTVFVCAWCGKEVASRSEEPPEGWRQVEYDVNKYTPEVETAHVCSVDCEVRLAEKYAAGGGR